MFLGVLLRSKHDYEAFWQENAEEESKAGGQDGKYLHSHSELPRRADVSRDECDPDCAEYQHAESDQFSLIEIIRKLSSQKSKNKTQHG